MQHDFHFTLKCVLWETVCGHWLAMYCWHMHLQPQFTAEAQRIFFFFQEKHIAYISSFQIHPSGFILLRSEGPGAPRGCFHAVILSFTEQNGEQVDKQGKVVLYKTNIRQ